MIRVIRPPSPLQQTHIRIKRGDLIIPYSMPTEREEKRLWREYGPPPKVESDAV